MLKTSFFAVFGTATKVDTFTKRNPICTPNGVTTSILDLLFVLCISDPIPYNICLSEI